ncbi:MAG: TonB-dependent receptor [Saprospiraceae bacterium]|nr:TonB-dependent receptor [Saprospiraceae bacterium]
MKHFIILLLSLLSAWASAQEVYRTKVEGDCGMCKDRIEETAMQTIGVLTAIWDEETHILEISMDPKLFVADELMKAIATAGHDTEKYKADDAVYQALPECCHYRPGDHDGHGHENGSAIIDHAVEEVIGIIYEKTAKGKKTAIIGATIYWVDGTAVTSSRSDGSFAIPMQPPHDKLVIQYVGYASDTVEIKKAGHIEVILKEGVMLDEIEIKERKRSIEVSYISPIKMRKISQRELTKAACCNLSESFETNPAIDVSFTDAVTGTKQIEMLGLAGPYVQITRENMPDVRGLASIYGLGFIPGPWIESIQLNLGTGSVLNGFESIAGQINVELKKPSDPERFFLNGYYGGGGRIEGNVVASTPVNDHFDTNVLFHYNTRNQAHDNNYDGFLDMPKGNGFSLTNNWKYFGENGNEGQIGVKVTQNDNTSGQDASHHEGLHPPGFELWKANIKSNRYEAWIKRGKNFLDKESTSIGFQLGGIYYDQKTLFGKRAYDGTQKMLYANLLYQTVLGSKDHKITMGSSFQAEQTEEQLAATTYERNEYVPGVFGEYTYSRNEKFDLVLGLRADHHNNYGFFMTPRLHLRYALSQFTVIRASAGRGQRTSNIIAENIGALASSREIIVDGDGSSKPYGLNAEVAWNYGLNLTHDFSPTIQYSLDLYLTNFENQIVADFDKNPQQFHLYNLAGKSFSRSIQTQVDINPVEGLDIRLAYRYNQVKTTYSGTLLDKPLISPHRTFANIGYEHKSGWKFDYTISWQGTKRIPSTINNPEEHRLNPRSEAYWLSNAQITKVFGRKFELYVGGENIFNFQQPNPIISPHDPFGQFFDASLVWGPVFGRMFYTGFRYRINAED